MLKKTQAFKTLLCLHGNWDYQSSKGNRKVVYFTVPLPMKIIKIHLHENSNRDQDPLHLNECAVKRTNN